MLNLFESAEGMSDASCPSLFFPVLFSGKCSISKGDSCSEEPG